VSRDRTGAETIINYVCSVEATVNRDEFGYGKTKIFVRAPETIFLMSEMLEKKLDPEGYKLKQLELKKVEKLAEKQRKKQLGGMSTKCIVM